MRIFLMLLMISFCYAEKPFLSSKGSAGDVWHTAGSLLLVLSYQKAFDLEWIDAAGYTFMTGFIWELGDSFVHRGVFDPSGFDPNDILRNILGIALSYPLRYDIKIEKNKVAFNYQIPLRSEKTRLNMYRKKNLY